MRHNFFFVAAALAALISIGAGAQEPATGPSSAGQGAGAATAESAMLPSAPDASPAELNGTVTDASGDLIPGATVVLEGPDASSHRTQVANDSAFFQFAGLKPGGPYRITVTANGFQNWSSAPITLAAG
jgi:hypothetical protein